MRLTLFGYSRFWIGVALIIDYETLIVEFRNVLSDFVAFGLLRTDEETEGGF